MQSQPTPRQTAAVAATVSRRLHLLEGAIIDSALRIRRPETERLAPLIDRMQAVWNSHADMIDAKFGAGFLGLRLARSGAASIYFRRDPEPSEAAPNGDMADGETIMRAIAMLDDLSEKTLIFPDAPAGIFSHMADLLFMAWLPETVIRRNAGGRDSLWNRRLRKTKIAQARGRAASLFNQQIELDAEQQERAEQQFASDLKARSDALDRAVLSDSTLRDFATGWRNWRVGARCNLGRLSKSGDDPATE